LAAFRGIGHKRCAFAPAQFFSFSRWCDRDRRAVSRAHFDPTVELPVDKLAGLDLDYVLTVWDNATLSVPYGGRWHNISEFGPDTP
jgi:hypothetical protein